MSQHNISGSEVFGPKPFVILRSMKTRALRRRRAAGAWAAFGAGVVVAAIGGLIAVAATLGQAGIG